MFGITDPSDAFAKQQEPLKVAMEQVRRIYQMDEIDSTTVALLRRGLESPAPPNVPEPFHTPTFQAQGVDFQQSPMCRKNPAGF